MNTQYEINKKTYQLSPLRMKHLKQISRLIATGIEGGLSSKLDAWKPFIEASIKVLHSDFDMAEIDELTLEEYIGLWKAVQTASGITVERKGEAKPAPVISGPSTVELPLQ